MTIVIRTARTEDAAVIAAFNCAMALETEGRQLDRARVEAGVLGLLGNSARGTYYLAEVESGRIAGQLLITYEWSDWRNGNFWWIQSVYVAPEFRGKGIFRALFAHIQKRAKTTADVCGLRLYVDASNAPAQQTYEKLGLKKTHYEFFELDFVLPPHG